MKTLKNLVKGTPPAVLVNYIWHVTSLTPCSTGEMWAGWIMVWLAFSAAIWGFSTLRQRKVVPAYQYSNELLVANLHLATKLK